MGHSPAILSAHGEQTPPDINSLSTRSFASLPLNLFLGWAYNTSSRKKNQGQRSNEQSHQQKHGNLSFYREVAPKTLLH
jgi:hypothetical protein